MSEKWKAFLKNRNNLFIIVLVGVLFLVIQIPVDSGERKGKSAGEDDGGGGIGGKPYQAAAGEGFYGEENLQDYCAYLEEKLEKILSKIAGAGQVKVMISMNSSSEKVVEKDRTLTSSGTEEKDSQGGTRKITNYDSGETTVYSSSGSNAEPYVVKELLPKVEGVIVLAEGAGTGNVSKNISDALQALFGIEAHKIGVVKMETP